MAFRIRSVIGVLLAVAMMASVMVVTDPPQAAAQEAPPSPFTPIADAGPDQTVNEGDLVELDASGSSDPTPGFLDPVTRSEALPGGTIIESSLDGITLGDDGAVIDASIAIGESPPQAETAIVYVVDVSGSANFSGGCAGDQNNDGRFNTRLDCMIAAVLQLNAEVIASGTVSEIGLISFSSGSTQRDLDPTANVSRLIAPDADADGNGVLDLEQEIRRLRAGGATNFSSPASSACSLLSNSSSPNRITVFMSDGDANRGTSLSNVLPCSPPVLFQSFAVGTGTSCNLGTRGLQTMANLTGGDCTQVTDLANLPDILTEVIAAQVLRAYITIDGGPEIDVSDQLDPVPPFDAPQAATLALSLDDLLAGLPPGVSEICLTVEGSDSGGTGEATACSEFVAGNLPLTYSWTLANFSGPPITLSSSTEPMTSFIAFDDGVYNFDVTVSNGLAEATDRVTVTVDNVAPTVEAQADPAVEGGVALITASFTDPGFFDTHTAVIDWGDGSPAETVPISAQGNGWGSLFATHSYADPGNFTATVTVTDDDGGVGAAQTFAVDVSDAVAVWGNHTSGTPVDISGSENSIDGLLRSNAKMRISGQDTEVTGEVEYVNNLNAESEQQFSIPPVQVPVAPFPVTFDLDDYKPGGRAAIEAGDSYFDMRSECNQNDKWDASGTLEPGLYYANCDVVFSPSDLEGEITVVTTRKIEVSGSEQNFVPFIDGLLFFANNGSTEAMKLNGSKSRFLGYVYTPRGTIEMSGSENRFVCGVLGKRIKLNGSKNEFTGSDCTRPTRTVAPPALVPNLELALDVVPDSVIPGDSAESTAVATNDGALLLVPGVVGIENVGDSSVTVNDITIGLEYKAVGGAWTTLDEPATISIRQNPAPNVTFGPNGFAGTVVDSDGLATWGAELQMQLPAATVAFLLDDTQVEGVRNVFDVDLDNPSNEPVRRLFRFGNDFLPALAAQTGDLTDVQITLTTIDGVNHLLDQGTDPTLALLGPGESAVVSASGTVATPDPRGGGETSEAYVARLQALDGTELGSGAYAFSTGGVGLVLAGQQVDSTTRQLPVVGLSAVGTLNAQPGDTLDYTLTSRNTGSVAATTVAMTAEVDGAAVSITDAVTSLDPGVVATSGATFDIPADTQPNIFRFDAESAWTDTNGNTYGPIDARVDTDVTLAPAVQAVLTDELLIDADGSGAPSSGDTIRYALALSNTGGAAVDNVTATTPLDSDTTLVAGSETTTDGTVSAAAGTFDLTVPSIAPGGSVTATVDVTLDTPFPKGTAVVQASITSDNTGLILSDDPAFVGSANATTTTVVEPFVALEPMMETALTIDLNGDGFPGAGDTLTHKVSVFNFGSIASSNTTFTLDPAEGNSLEVGSVTTDTGAVASGNTAGDTIVQVDIGSIAAGEQSELMFNTIVDEDLSEELTGLENTGTISADGIDDIEVDLASGILIEFTTGGGPGGIGPVQGPAEWGEIGPEEGLLVTAPVDVTLGSVTLPDGITTDTWQVVAYPVGGDPANSVTISSGAGEPPATLGELDPTVLSNGVWVLRIELVDSNGNTSVTETSFVVEGNLKLGRFATTYLDSSVTVGGIPLQVLRTYDTLDRFESGDFGFGWTLDVADFRVSTNGPLGTAQWTADSCGSGGLIFTDLCWSGDPASYVTVTWPDGNTESFDFTPKGNTFFSILAVAEYTPRDRATSKLFPVDGDGSVTLSQSDGQFHSGGFGSGPVYDPQRFILEAQDGSRYLLDRDDGLIQSTDRNGNTVTVSDDGIVSSLGPALTFTRDAADRITTVTEPDGDTVTYAYDAAGDLVSVTDQKGATSTFGYDSSHYLTEIEDPTGAQRTFTYDADGRISAITDANGNTTQVSIDPDARTEVVTMPDGNLTRVTTFDERGNALTIDEIYDGQSHVTTLTHNTDDQITSRTDPEGNVWAATYDDSENLTSFVDAENNTSLFTYNELGLPLTITDPDGYVTTVAYNGVGNIESITDPRNGVQLFTYDDRGNQITRTDQVGRVWEWSYDSESRVIGATDPRGNATAYTYNANGQVATMTAPDGGVTSYAYDGVGNLLSATDPVGRTTSYVYDGRDLLTSITDASSAATAYTYDGNGRVLTRTDPTGRTWSYAYEFDRLVSETAPDGGTTSYAYDAAGRVAQMTDPLGRVTTYGYDSAHRRTQVTSPIDSGGTAVSTTTYDGNGRSATVTNAESETVSYAYDPLGRLVSITDPIGRVTIYTYDPVGNRTSVTNAESESTIWGHDLAGQLTSMTNAEGEATTYTYDLAGNLASITDPLGRVTSFDYDEVNRRESITVPSGDTGATVYDLAGQVTSTTSPAGFSTSYTYDPRGLLESAADELGNVNSSAYDAAGRVVAMTDARSNATTLSYDPNGRLLTETDPLGGAVTFGYDLAGQRTSVTDPNGATRTFSYDDGGRMTTAVDAEGRITTYAYDAVGRQIEMTDARGVTIASVFDDAGQMSSRLSPNETQSFSYDLAGRRTGWTDASGATSATYDDVGRMTGITSAAGTVSYGYNVAGEQVSMTQPEGTTTATYDVNGFAAGIVDWRGDTIAMTNDADGRMTAVSRSNGVDTSYGYDDAGRMTDVGHTGPAGVIDSFAYTLDGNGNRIGVTSTAGTESYTLDALNRVTSATYPGAVSESFVYDAAGNRISHSKTDGTTVGYTVDATGQLVSDTTGTTYTYDDAGNLTGTSAGDSYTYDDYGRTTSVSAGGTTQTYGYDAAGVRVSADGVGQLWDRSGLPTLISTSAGDNYVHAAGVARDGDDWLLPDAIGSVRNTVDDTGATTGTASYSAFGEQLAGTTETFGFAGEQLDPTGQIHLRARQYNPGLGRFTSVDPVQPGAPSTTGWNLYSYAGNNPTSWNDPSGRAVAIEYRLVLALAAAVLVTAYLYTPAAQEQLRESSEAIAAIFDQIFDEIIDFNFPNRDPQDNNNDDDKPKPIDDPFPPKIPDSDDSDDECPDLGAGSVTYGPMSQRTWNGNGSVQFASGASATLTPEWIAQNGRASSPNPQPSPPGWAGRPYDRAHLIGAQLGGSNTDGRNFVSLHQNKNRGRMRVIEGEVKAAVMACDIVTYSATPQYSYAIPQPLESVTVLAVSVEKGVIVNEVIPNTGP